MKFFLLFTLLVSGIASAQTKLGAEAVEMFKLFTHPEVSQCLERANTRLVNIEIKKLVARCPGCNTYVITGNELRIDVPTNDKTIITISGKMVRSNFGYVQTYMCDVKQARR